MVLATSNKPWDLDEAMRRRLERRIYIPLPDEPSRLAMLRIHLSGVALASDVSLATLATQTSGYSGADLQLACRDASMMPMRRAVDGKTPQEIIELHAAGALESEVGANDFRLALTHTQPSVTPEETAAYVAWNRDHGCAASGAATGPNLAPPAPPSASASGAAAARPRARLAPLEGEQEASVDELNEEMLVAEVC